MSSNFIEIKTFIDKFSRVSGLIKTYLTFLDSTWRVQVDFSPVLRLTWVLGSKEMVEVKCTLLTGTHWNSGENSPSHKRTINVNSHVKAGLGKLPSLFNHTVHVNSEKDRATFRFSFGKIAFQARYFPETYIQYVLQYLYLAYRKMKMWMESQVKLPSLPVYLPGNKTTWWNRWALPATFCLRNAGRWYSIFQMVRKPSKSSKTNLDIFGLILWNLN